MTALAVSMGDPAGIGLDIILECWLRRTSESLPAFFVAGDPNALEARAKALGLDVPISMSTPENAAARFADTLPVIPVHCAVPPVAGTPDEANAGAVIEAIRHSVELVCEGRAHAIVTAPIAKSVLYGAGFGFPGHTEFLAALATERTGIPMRPVMLLANDKLKVVPVTIHIPLSAVPAALTREAIIESGSILAHELETRFGIKAPRIAVSGLNPHAGEGGALGAEDDAVIVPAIATLKDEGIDAFGPLPADTMFHDEARATYDAALCMYHDQALIPVKTLGFHDGVNVTLGLPFIRTSPDHGTAFGIAGSGKARCDSMIAALRMAGRMATFEAAQREAALV